MSERHGEIKSYIDGPRWARSDRFIETAALLSGLECEVNRETSLLREHVRFKVSGKESGLREFESLLRDAVARYSNA